MVVGSSTAFAGVFTYHADGFVVVFVVGTGRAVAFAVVAGVFITASRPIFFVLENVSAVSARELLFVFLVFGVKAITAQSLTLFGDFETAFGFDLSAVGTSEFHFDFGGRAGATGGGATGSTLKLTFFFVEPFSAFVFSAVAFFGLRSAGEAVGFDWLKVAFVVGVDTAFHTAVVVFVANNNGASLLVVS